MSRCIVLWLALNCACFGFRSQVQAVRKCCGEHRVLDYERQRCSFPQTHAYNSSFTEDSIYATERFPFQCPAGLSTANVTLHNLSGTVTIPDSNKTLQYSEFCVASEPLENESVTIAFCKPQTIDKCCPIGQAIHPSLRKCVPAQDAPNVEKVKRYDGQSFQVSHNSNRAEYILKYCTNRMTRYHDSIKLDERSEAVMTESLNNATKDVSYYCIDALGDQASGNYSVIAMIGRTWTRQRYFGTIRILFPKICFGSSLFLLLTLIYYCTMPKIRQTLHGYSMICFLFSMLIVQLDIGVYFTLSNSTCVCAIIPYHRTFFRYASTAWTTVMGYIMWTALNRNGEPRGQKSQGVIFAIYSAYVWGLALALVTVGFIYDQYHPLTSACFWETLHVKMFMDLPNIVLQLLNNVFFVPIAVHVWRRFRVVNKSADSRSGNTLDTERKTALIKMFAVAQGTKLAEVLFSIRSLFHIRSFDYFMATSCLYSLNGPLLFCVLVDIYAFINRESVAKLRSSVRSTVFRQSSFVLSNPSDKRGLEIESIGSALDGKSISLK